MRNRKTSAYKTLSVFIECLICGFLETLRYPLHFLGFLQVDVCFRVTRDKVAQGNCGQFTKKLTYVR